MLRLSNMKIGTKLMVMSGLGVLLVVALVALTMYNDTRVKATSDLATGQLAIVTDIKNIQSQFEQARLAMRNIRLAADDAELSRVSDLSSMRKNVDTLAESLLKRLKVPENRERLKKVQANIARYNELLVKELVPVKAEALGVRAKNPARYVQFEGELANVQKTHLDPLVGETAAQLKQIGDIASKLAKEFDSKADEVMASAEHINLVVGFAIVVILIGSAIMGVVTIAKPLRAMVKPLDDVASGNFTVTVPGLGRKDEVGQIAGAVGRMVDKVSSSIGEIKASGREVTNASAEISTSTTDLSQRTEEQAASLEETSAAMEELSATVKKNADNAQEANRSAGNTREVADRGGEVVAHAVEAMAKIEESSRQIGDIIGVIDEIARQTNLLALNAAVEAARAGEAGRGFAVVASEVRSLAQRSSQAAKDIKDLITNSNGQVKEGVELVNRAGASLNEIVESIKSVAAIVSDIASASAEQATGLEQINKALAQMDEVTQQNSALVEENAATAKTLEHQARAMDEQVAYFQIANAGEGHQWVSSSAMAKPPVSKPKPMAKPVRAKPAAAKPEAAKPEPVKPEVAKRAVAGRSGGPVGHMQTALAQAVNADDWKEF